VPKTSTLLGLLLIFAGSAQLLAQSPRPLPRSAMTPDGKRSSEIGAIALQCAAEVNATLSMYQLLFKDAEIDRKKIDAAAAALGLEERPSPVARTLRTRRLNC